MAADINQEYQDRAEKMYVAEGEMKFVISMLGDTIAKDLSLLLDGYKKPGEILNLQRSIFARLNLNGNIFEVVTSDSEKR